MLEELQTKEKQLEQMLHNDNPLGYVLYFILQIHSPINFHLYQCSGFWHDDVGENDLNLEIDWRFQ